MFDTNMFSKRLRVSLPFNAISPYLTIISSNFTTVKLSLITLIFGKKKNDMSREIEKLNEHVSHLLLGFESCYFKDGKSIPTYETESWRLQMKRIMREYYEV